MKHKLARFTVAATAVAALTTGAITPAHAEDTNASSLNTTLSGDSNSSSAASPAEVILLVLLGSVGAAVFAEGLVSILNAPFCGANPDRCPNSLVAALSSGASSQIDEARARVPQVAIPRR
ncbi:hypothetical protein ACFPVT_02170 [Corynebacterium choanae]|nr:hypothetical protein [Corynebacterium choanae]